jgi:hypothetical protein
MATSVRKLHDANKKVHIDWSCQWPEWFKRDYNWRNFTIIELSIEAGSLTGSYLEIEIGLLGVGCCIQVIDTLERALFIAEMEQHIHAIRDSRQDQVEDTNEEQP